MLFEGGNRSISLSRRFIRAYFSAHSMAWDLYLNLSIRPLYLTGNKQLKLSFSTIGICMTCWHHNAAIADAFPVTGGTFSELVDVVYAVEVSVGYGLRGTTC